MVTNFEDITGDLTEEEIKLLPILIKAFRKKDSNTAVKGPNIIKGINECRDKYGLTKKFSEPRLRKLCNLIRSKSLLPLIATSKGYYVSYDKKEIKNQIDSLKDRAYAILASAEGLEKFLLDENNIST